MAPIIPADLPIWRTPVGVPQDWLLKRPAARATVYRRADGQGIVLANGLIARDIRLAPNAATVALDDLRTGASLLRAVRPEAWVTLNGTRYAVGGLAGQPDRAFLSPEWEAKLQADPNSFWYAGLTLGPIPASMEWRRTPGDPKSPWPPPGVRAALRFHAPPGIEGVSVTLYYDLYDNLPCVCRSMVVHNQSANPVRVDSFCVESLALVEGGSSVEEIDDWVLPNVSVLTDYRFGGEGQRDHNRTIYWLKDPDYGTQVSYMLETPCILEVRPPYGPAVDLPPDGALLSFRSYLLIHDSRDRERKGLAVRRAFRTLSPWVLDNPLMLHLTDSNPAAVRRAVDQCADVGFEMVILSFGSGLDMEDTSEANIARWKALADYAHAKGIRMGGYSLLASRRINDDEDVINPKTGKTGGAIFGNSPCLGSKWGIAYFDHVKTFLERTGFDLLEHDGSYPGDVCASTSHPGHRDLEDSQWTQYARIWEFYRWCRSRGIFLNVPDCYALAGANKTAMGYRETNWSLPREWQPVHARQNLFDGTWEKTPSMGWMFTPLVQYQGGGAAATIEPLKEHLPDYARHLSANLGFGAQACYRGPRLYDAPETRALVLRWVQWFKKHRAILESDVIHVRRSDGRGVDVILHANPDLPTRGLAMVYNPTAAAVTTTVRLPVHYTGLRGAITLRVADGKPVRRRADADGVLAVKVTVPAGDCTWLTLE